MTTAPSPLRVLCLTMNPAVDLATQTERVQHTHKLRCSATLHDAGGGGINVARVLTRLGGSTRALCPAGGSTGHWLRQRLKHEAIDTVFVPIGEETRVSFTVHESQTGNEFRFVMPGPLLAETEWRACLSHLETLQPFPDLLVASGSLPPGVPVDFYARLAQQAQQRGARLLLDTDAAPLSAALEQGVFLIKPNLRELSAHVGGTLDTRTAQIEAARGLIRAARCAVVALTLGHQGALLVTREASWFAAPLPISPLSAVGAGDSFLGGMVWALQQQQALVDAFAWGVAAGSAALLSAGTGLCCLEDIQRLRPQVAITPLAT